ncbi:GTP 3',8-cyclase, mitochondrial isoform X3 [Manduca sexta]|uniref:GTP 3',8-cyclase, mitochondrial isoform X3 n=1 Tax=Manduca sexta TaxID=7130 RepID=UPI00118412D1|nr:GTP 3',8-cyclase, mitochondrial isoform X3 [Manduca sexta]
MRFRVNNLLNLSRVIENDATAGVCARPLSRFRRTYSDVASTAAVAAQSESAPEPGLGLNTTEPLTDLHGRRHNYLRISLTERCNLRCQYCMPAEGVPLSPKGALLSREELARLVRVFAAAGVDKVRLTGGEPTLRADLADIIQSIKEGGGVRSVSITTNGLVLTRRLVALQRAGLDALNVSLDTLRAPRYEHMTRRAGLSRVLAGIDLALQLGYKPVKINTVLMKGFNDDEICDFVEFTKDKDVEVRFIEFMPFAGNEWDDSKLVPYRRALKAVVERFPDLQPAVPRPHDTARVWQVPGFAGSVGFISSMTQHFCSSCNRLRLTADGNLKVCLFGASEVSLRDALRTGADDAQLDRLVRLALRNKKPQHAGMQNLAHMENRPMILIGG